LSSNSWDSSIWVRVNLIAQGNTLQVQVSRLDSGQYLNQDGDWQTDPAIAMSVTDSGLAAGGSVGLVRPASYSGSLVFDDFDAQALPTEPTTAPPDGVAVDGAVPTAPPDDAGPPSAPSDTPVPVPSSPPTHSAPNPPGDAITPPAPSAGLPDVG